MIARIDKFPVISPPVGPYTSYKVSVSEEGYAISYKANDPKTMYKTTKIKEKGGFLGLANENKEIVEEYTMEGDAHISGSVNKQDNPMLVINQKRVLKRLVLQKELEDLALALVLLLLLLSVVFLL